MLSSQKSRIAAFSTAVIAFAAMSGSALAQKKYDTGATDTEIKIGNIMPYSGPASAYGVIGKTEEAYFKKINAEGGINGRKINFVTYDDGYSPPKAVEQARKLVESDEALLVFNSLGTANNTAIQKYMNSKKVPQLLKLGVFEHWTGGVQGLVVTKPDAPFGLPMSQDMWLYYFTLAVSIAIYIFSVNLLKSRSGRAFMAIRDNEIAASAMGIDVALYKTLAFGVSAGITGVAGGLGAIAVQFVAPDSFTITLAIQLFLGMVVGGVGWLPGSIVGAAFIIFVPNIAESISKGLSGAVFGVLLFLVIFLVPHGARQVAMVAQGLIGKLKKN